MINTNDMICVHRIFRTAFTSAAEQSRIIATESDPGRQVVLDYYQFILGFLHAHHESEDSILWPLLYQRVTDTEAQLVKTNEAQHERLASQLAELDSQLEQLQSELTVQGLLQLLTTIDRAAPEMLCHLDDEEQHILPLCQQHLTAEEYGALPGTTMQKLEPGQLFLAIGLVRDEFDQELLDHMDANMPPPVKEGWLEAGKQQYEAFKQAITPLIAAQ